MINAVFTIREGAQPFNGETTPEGALDQALEAIMCADPASIAAGCEWLQRNAFSIENTKTGEVIFPNV